MSGDPRKDPLASLDRLTIRVARIVAILGLGALLALAVLILANAGMRWLFVSPIEGVRDWEKLIIALAIGSCLPPALALRQNVTIRFVGRVLPRRGGAGLELFGAFLTLVMFALLAWQLQDWTLDLREQGDTTENIRMTIWPWWQAVTVLFYFSVMVQRLVVLRLVGALWRGEPVLDEPTSEPAAAERSAEQPAAHG